METDPPPPTEGLFSYFVAISGTAMRHAYTNAAAIAKGADHA